MPDDRLTHPQQAKLLAHLDGEMTPYESEQVWIHLQACWSCRMHADALQRTIVAYARYRERSTIPAPPRPWKDLTSDFRLLDESGPSLWSRIRSGTMLRIAATCGVAALAAAAWVNLPRAPATQRKESPPAVTTPALAVQEPPPVTLWRAPEPIAPQRGGTGLHEEVAMTAELHRLDADLGEPIDLERRPGGQLRLRGLGLSPERQTAIRDAMSRIPGVSMSFENPAPDQTDTNSKAAVSAARRPVAFAAELIQLLGTKQALERFTNSVLDASDAAVSRAHALRKLEQRFPNPAALDPEDRAIIENIRADHRKRLQEATAELQHLLNPVFEHFAVQPAAVPPAALVESASQLDRLVNSAFAGAQSSLSDRGLYAALKGWLLRLGELQ